MATHDYECPKCGSVDTSSARSVYEKGTFAVSGSVVGVFGDGLGVAKHTGIQQSHLARQCAPPLSRQKDINPGCGCLMIVLPLSTIFAAMTSKDSLIPGVILLIVELVIFAAVWGKNKQDNDAAEIDHLQSMKRYEKAIVCMKCHYFFIPTQAANVSLLESEQSETEGGKRAAKKSRKVIVPKPMPPPTNGD